MVKPLDPGHEALKADCDAGLLPHEMASKYNVSKASIKRYLKKHGLVHIDTKDSVSWASAIRNSYDTDRREHISQKMAEIWKCDEYRSNQIEIHNSDEYVDSMSMLIKDKWQDPTYISNNNKSRDAEYRSKISSASKRNWQDSEYATTVIKSAAATHTDEYRQLQREVSTRVWSNPELVESHRQKSLSMWQDQKYRSKQIAIRSTDEYRAKCSDAISRLWQDPEYRAKMASVRENTSISMTRPHLKVCEILESIGVEHVVEKAIGPYNFDIFIPSHNLLIEVHGNYWHNLPKAMRNDKAKATYIQKYHQDLVLKCIWEHECLEIGKVEAKLKYWLGIGSIDHIQYEFDDLTVSLFSDTAVVDALLYNWHYQHHGRHGLDICGFLGSELICVARFTSPTRNESATSLGYKVQEVLELSRLVVHPKYQKKNLLSWFLARCEKCIRSSRSDIRCLVSFADSTFNHTGTVYKASNWSLVKVVDPDYWYVSSDGWAKHKKTLWNHATSLRMSESEYADKYGYSKVWGKEKYKFIKILGTVR